MDTYRVERDGSVFAIGAEPGSGEVLFTITPAGSPPATFAGDIPAAEEIRLLTGSAIGTAQDETS